MCEVYDLKDGPQVKAVPGVDGCDGCYFDCDNPLLANAGIAECYCDDRHDGQDAIFKRHYRTGQAIAVKVEL